MPFPRITCEFLPRFNVREFFRPAQVDAHGNFNNVIIGSDYARPQMRLPGSGGIPDVTIFDQHAMLYVPRHSRAVFVEQVDFISGLGHTPDRSAGRGPQYCITNLGQFDFAHGAHAADRRIIPANRSRRFRPRPAFSWKCAPDVRETEPPTA